MRFEASSILSLGLMTAALAACSGGDSGETVSGTATNGSGNVGASSSGEGGASSSGEGGASSSGEGGASSSGSGGAGTKLAMLVFPSALATVDAANGGSLSLECRVLEDGLAKPLASPPTAKLSPLDGVTEQSGTYTFAKYGVYTATCEGEVDGQKLSASTDIAVLNEALEPAVATLGRGASRLGRALFDLSAAQNGADDAVVKAVMALDDATSDLAAKEVVGLKNLLRLLPAGGYPTTAELKAKGIQPSADDDALPGALAALGAALDDVGSAYGAVGDTVGMGDLVSLEAARVALDEAVANLTKLKPTAHGFLAQQSATAELLSKKLAPALTTMASKTKAVVKKEAATLFANKALPKPPGGGQQPYFGFLSLTLGAFGNSSLQMTLVGKIYGKYLGELDKSINNLIAADLIDYLLPPAQGGPVVEYLVASASLGFAKVGYPSYVEGYNFHKEPSFNQFFIIGDQWQTIAESVFSACGVGDAKSLPGKIAKVDECLKDVAEAVDEFSIVPMSVEPGDFSDQHLDLGEFPPACSGSLPTAIALIPVNFTVGRGPSVKTNCIK